MMIDNAGIGKRIARLRQEKSLTQQQLAAMLGVSHQAVSKWESGAALPDIQIMLELTRMFGITVEQLTTDEAEQTAEEEEYKEESGAQSAADETDDKEEGTMMNIQQLLSMAPFMSKEAVEEIAMKLEDKLTALQIARLAPFVHAQCLEALIDKNEPEMGWDTLRRIAPFLSREAVDNIARSIASGERVVRPAGEAINKTFDDIGKTFDEIGKGVGQAVQKAIKFGGDVFNEVSTAFSDMASDAEETAAHKRSEKATQIRKKAFERALNDGKWEWLGEHIYEINDDTELKSRIAARAKELGMHDWICTYMGGYADEFTIEAAITNGNWSWLGDNAWQLEKSMQVKVALAAMKAENWLWLGRYSDQLELSECGMEIAHTAWKAGAKVFAAQMAENHLAPAEINQLAREMYDAEDYEALDLVFKLAEMDCRGEILTDMAEKRDWTHIKHYIDGISADIVEKLMETAVDQGNFDAVDMLDAQL